MTLLEMNARPLGDALGLEVGGVDLNRVTDAQMVEITDYFDRASALLIRGQALSPEALVAFSRRLGTLDEAPVNEAGKTVVAGLPELYVVSNMVGNRSVREFVDAHAAAQPEKMFLVTTNPGARVSYGVLKSL